MRVASHRLARPTKDRVRLPLTTTVVRGLIIFPAAEIGVQSSPATTGELHGLPTNVPVPIDAVTRSGSGLDPHIGPANTALQVERVARESKRNADTIRGLVAENTSLTAVRDSRCQPGLGARTQPRHRQSGDRFLVLGTSCSSALELPARACRRVDRRALEDVDSQRSSTSETWIPVWSIPCPFRPGESVGTIAS